MDGVITTFSENGVVRPDRRSVMQYLVLGGASVAAAAALPAAVKAQAPSGPAPAPTPLPLQLDTLFHHTGISVPDVRASATFYSKLFGGNNVAGEMVAMPGGKSSERYFIRTGTGSVAIGLLGTLGSAGLTTPLIDHICVGAKAYDAMAWRERLKLQHYQYIASEVFLGFDNLPIQVAGGHGGEGLSGGTPASLPVLYSGPALVHGLGFDHVVERVTDVEKAVAFWKEMFGVRELRRDAGLVWLTDGNLKLGVRAIARDEKPGYDYQAFRATRFDPKKIASGLTALGATILPKDPFGQAGWVKFLGPDGIRSALVPA